MKRGGCLWAISACFLVPGLVAAALLRGFYTSAGMLFLLVPALPLWLLMDRAGVAEQTQLVFLRGAHSLPVLSWGGLVLVYFFPALLCAVLAFRRTGRA